MARRRLQLKILSSTPCTQPWSGMQGNERERHCQACDKRVHNFAAMSARQIEELVRAQGGSLCARAAFRADGSLQTLGGEFHRPMAAGLLLASALALPAMSMAQSVDGEKPTAHLSGTILKPDNSGPIQGAFVALLLNHQIVASAHTGSDGAFQVTAPPGRYDVAFGTTESNIMRIPNYELHAGFQDLDPVPLMSQSSTTVTVEANYEDSALVGALSMTLGRPRFFWYFFEHPIRYVRSYRHSS